MSSHKSKKTSRRGSNNESGGCGGMPETSDRMAGEADTQYRMPGSEDPGSDVSSTMHANDDEHDGGMPGGGMEARDEGADDGMPGGPMGGGSGGGKNGNGGGGGGGYGEGTRRVRAIAGRWMCIAGCCRRTRPTPVPGTKSKIILACSRTRCRCAAGHHPHPGGGARGVEHGGAKYF